MGVIPALCGLVLVSSQGFAQCGPVCDDGDPCTRDVLVLFGARAKFAQNFDVIDEYIAVRVTQFFFDLENRCLLENVCVHSAQKLEKKF